MANGHGGYRAPDHPAPVSGPGALSRRTDGGVPTMDVTGGSYGSAQDFRAQQGGAPMSGQSATPPQMPVSLGAPTQNPGQPVTAGADAGPGPTAAELGLTTPADDQIKRKLGPMLPVFMRMADSPYATDDFKLQVRQLIARVNQ